MLFSGLVLLYIVRLNRWYSGKEEQTKGICLRFVLLSVLMLLFRNNALYAWLVCQPFLLYFAGKKGMLKRYAMIAAATLFLFGMGSVGLKTAVAAQNGSPREMLSIPLQQMARTRVMHEEEIDEDMRRRLDSYLPSEWVFAAYNPYLADPVKNRAVIHDDPKGLIKTWAQLGVQFPMTYVDAFWTILSDTGIWRIRRIRLYMASERKVVSDIFPRITERCLPDTKL